MLEATFELTFVPWSMRPFSSSKAVFFVFVPLTVVYNAVCVLVRALALSFVVNPLSGVYVSIRIVESPSSVNFVIFEHALILHAIQLSLNSIAVSFITKPISFINVAICKSDSVLLDSNDRLLILVLVIQDWILALMNNLHRFTRIAIRAKLISLCRCCQYLVLIERNLRIRTMQNSSSFNWLRVD